MPPASGFSKSQIDRLGDRLKKGDIKDSDLRLLDSYRRSFSEAYEAVVGQVRNQLGLEPTGRPAKSTTSISEKLRRETIRLTQMQDVAGCRLIVEDLATQDDVTAQLIKHFDKAVPIDRRERPSHGYRAVHVIVDYRGKLIEIQVRTRLQHAWAQFSEKLSDVLDVEIKYGGGNQDVVSLLGNMSDVTMNIEIAIKARDSRITKELQRWSELEKKLQELMRRLEG